MENCWRPKILRERICNSRVPRPRPSTRPSITRMKDAIQMKKTPDSVPLGLMPSMWPFINAGMTVQEAMYDYDKCTSAFRAFMLEYQPDMNIGAASPGPGRFYDIMDYKLYAWPGHGVAPRAQLSGH